MFNSETEGSLRDSILNAARAKATEKRVGAYTISVKVDGALQEVKDASELDRLIASGSDVQYHGILVDGKGGVVR